MCCLPEDDDDGEVDEEREEREQTSCGFAIYYRIFDCMPCEKRFCSLSSTYSHRRWNREREESEGGRRNMKRRRKKCDLCVRAAAIAAIAFFLFEVAGKMCISSVRLHT